MAWAQRAVAAGLSVRDLERAATEHRDTTSEPAAKSLPKPRDPNIVTAEEQLALKIGAKVEIRTRRRGGSIGISVADQAELMRVYDQLMEGS